MRNAEKPGGRKKRASGQLTGQKPLARNNPAGANRKSETLRRAAINLFILFHLIAITCVAVPWNVSIVKVVKGLVAPYLRWTGLYQTWDMFAPDPMKINADVKSVVMTRNRHVRVWSFPRMEELGFAERYGKERYRKFAEILPLPQNAPLWPDVARKIARSFRSQTDPPEKIMLIQFVSDIDPGADESHEPAVTPNVFYDDYLQPGDFE
jgi:hypothetical protein